MWEVKGGLLCTLYCDGVTYSKIPSWQRQKKPEVRPRRHKILLFISHHHFRERMCSNDWLTLGANVSPMRRRGGGGGVRGGTDEKSSPVQMQILWRLLALAGVALHSSLSLSRPLIKWLTPGRQLNFLKRSRHLIQLCSHYRFVLAASALAGTPWL